MVIVRMEHGVKDYDIWKHAFDSDPLNRRGSGVRRYRVARATDDPNTVSIDLEIDDVVTAEFMRDRLHQLWAGPARELIVTPTSRLLTLTEEVTLL